LLLAPALHRVARAGVAGPLRAHCPTHILHGRRDQVVPIEASRAFAADNSELVTLQEVEDDHSLAASMDEIVRLASLLSVPGTAARS
jgi:pimeloyl-ACP methyl ester carboxylesterase